MSWISDAMDKSFNGEGWQPPKPPPKAVAGDWGDYDLRPLGKHIIVTHQRGEFVVEIDGQEGE